MSAFCATSCSCQNGFPLPVQALQSCRVCYTEGVSGRAQMMLRCHDLACKQGSCFAAVTHLRLPFQLRSHLGYVPLSCCKPGLPVSPARCAWLLCCSNCCKQASISAVPWLIADQLHLADTVHVSCYSAAHSYMCRHAAGIAVSRKRGQVQTELYVANKSLQQHCWYSISL